MYEEKVIDIDDLFLNLNNYRIDFDHYNTLPKVVERLFLDERIMDMIDGIVSFHGMYPHEKLIVVPKEDGKYKVLEGNRRLLAVKCLLNKIEPPVRNKKEVNAASSKLDAKAIESLKHLGVIVYSTDDKNYLKILADKHSTVNYQRWGQISQWHFFRDLYEQNNKDLEMTANDLGKKKSDVSNYIRLYNLFSYIRSLPYWDENKLKEQIESNTLKATKFTRPLQFKKVIKSLGLEFNHALELKIPENESVNEFNQILCRFTAKALIYDNNDDDYIDTRSDEGYIIELLDDWKKEISANKEKKEEKKEDKTKEDDPNVPKGDKNEDKKKEEVNEIKQGKSAIYFENLKCSVDDQRLRKITEELVYISKSNKIDRFTISGTMLTRALIESAILFRINQKSLTDDLKKQHEGINDINIKELLAFAINNSQKLFSDFKNAKRVLEKIQGEHRDYLNSIIHGGWLDPKSDEIAKIASTTRELLRTILTDSP